MLILSAGATLLHAQSIVEFGALTGRAAGTAGGAKAGQSIVDIFGKVSKTVTEAGAVDSNAKPKSLPVTAAPATKIAVTPQAKPEPVLPPDLSALAIGMDRADMVKKVGKPWMSISSVEDSRLVETCTYRSGSDTVTVTLRDGKVAAIAGLENLAAKQALPPVNDPVSH